MPITYLVDKARNVVLVTWQGDVTAEDYRQHLRTMLQDPDALRAGRSLTDLTEATVLLSVDWIARYRAFWTEHVGRLERLLEKMDE